MNSNFFNIVTDSDRFRLYFSYNRTLIRELSKIGSARFDVSLGCWTVPKKEKLLLDQVIYFAEKKTDVEVKWLSHEEEVLEFSERMPILEEECDFRMKPYEYQLRGIRYMIEKKRTFNGDDMGLGKTLQSIVAVSVAKAFPCLVVCPACMKMTWKREFWKITGKNAVLLSDENKGNWHNHIINGTANIFIVNYESLKKFFVLGVKGKRLTVKNLMLDKRVDLFRTVIIDECHRCKESSTQWSKYLEAMCAQKPYVFMLTGTPLVTGIRDLEQQLRIMGRLDDFGGAAKFREKFCHEDLSPELMSELNAMLWEHCYFRRDKSLVLKELPEMIRQYHTFHISNEAEYLHVENDFANYLMRQKGMNEANISKSLMNQAIVKIGHLRQVCAKGKLNTAISLIDDVIASGSKIIVFAVHKAIVKAIKAQFPGAVSVTGDDSTEAKQKAVDKFQTSPDCKVIVLNIKSGGVGITLTAASHVLFVELPWTAADCDQCECRAYRNGQKSVVTCTYLIGENTIDEDIWNIIERERKQAGIVTGSKDSGRLEVIKGLYNRFTT